ncbi:hypothetical protein D0C36_18735 [Mucilaginibacter conchicola]|uniref:Uncharacterized protein n=2 Tax=Mucilaginibacter conchicola TaxID=2303333 RepID=A0A372NRT1_9SPHI|nr:hypothetical protein D0C36_18735 [Mucilaginibacter conchicola]
MFSFLFFAPYWQLLLAFIPIAIFAWLRIEPVYQPLCLIVLIPLLSFDIQILEAEDWHFKGAWRYLSFLPGLVLITILFVLFPPSHYSGSLASIIWKVICITAFGNLICKMWLTDPFLLFINRLKTTHSQETIYKVATVETQQKGRGFSYYVICSNKVRIEVSGFIYLYLLTRGLRKGGLLTLNFKTGWLGITYANGFPKVTRPF